MTRALCAAAMFALLLVVALSGQQQSDWTSASNDPDIQYRVQAFDTSKACELEYRDRKQKTGYTTFDVNVDYKSTELDSDNHPKTKTETEHITTAPSHTGSSRISECIAVVEARVSFVQRH
jgi:hypothetical protein